MNDILRYYFDLSIMAKALPALLDGLLVTLELAALTILLGLGIGIGLAIARAFRIRVVSVAIILFVDVFRALPPLVVLLLIYFGLPYGGLVIGAFAAAVITLSLALAALVEEIVWAGILSVETGQWDAARSTGLGFLAALLLVVLPQGVRLVLPPLTNKVISITKYTSLASVVAVPELLNQASTEQGTFANPSPLMLAAIMFVALFLPLVRATRWLERRYGTPA